MYEVEINGSEVLIDLIGRMADLTAAQYETRLVLRTENRRLANAVSVLLGEPMVVDPELDETTGLGFGLLDLSNPLAADNGGPHSDFVIPDADGVAVIAKTALDLVRAEEKANGRVVMTPEGKRNYCRYCGELVGPRRRVCEKGPCQKAARHDVYKRYAPKKADKEAAMRAALAEKLAQGQEAAPASESPFAGKSPLSTEPEYLVPWIAEMLTFEELMTGNQAGEIPDGAHIQAQPSGRWYVLSAGRLTPDGAAGQ